MKIIAYIMLAIGFLGSLYISWWWGLIEPIIDIATMIIDRQLDIWLVAWSVAKFALRSLVSALWFVAWTSLAGNLVDLT